MLNTPGISKVKLFLSYIHSSDTVKALCVTSEIDVLNSLGWLIKKKKKVFCLPVLSRVTAENTLAGCFIINNQRPVLMSHGWCNPATQTHSPSGAVNISLILGLGHTCTCCLGSAKNPKYLLGLQNSCSPKISGSLSLQIC